MKGLILYELYKMKAAYMKNLTLVAVLYLVISIGMQTEAIVFMLIWMMGFYAVGAIALDEHFYRFARALPVRPAQLAGAKFAIAGIMIALGAVYSLLTGVAICALQKSAYADFVTALAIILLLSVAVTSIMLPCSVKWGVEKARNTMMLVFAAVFGGGAFASKALDMSGAAQWLTGHVGVITAALTVFAALTVVLGWMATAKIYASKEV